MIKKCYNYIYVITKDLKLFKKQEKIKKSKNSKTKYLNLNFKIN